MIQDTR